MKKQCLIVLFAGWAMHSVAQEITKDAAVELSKPEFLKSSSEAACKCIDTIQAEGVLKEEIAKRIHDCIEVQVGSYMLGAKLMDKNFLGKQIKKGKTEIQLDINMDPSSPEFKQHYYELERYLMDSCSSLKDKIRTNEKTNKHSFSSNQEAKDWYAKGLDESAKGNINAAIESYVKALKIDSNFAFAWDNLGICYRQKEQYDSAIYAYKKSLQIDPRGLTPLQNLAVAYLLKNEYEKAISTYQHIAKLEPNNPEIYYGIGNVQALYLHNYEEGLNNMCKAYNLYIRLQSPYRTDAEKIINQIYASMKKEGNEKKFKAILKEHNIKME